MARLVNDAFRQLVQRSEKEAFELDISKVYVNPEVSNSIRTRLQAGKSVLNAMVELYLPDMPDVPPVWRQPQG